MFYSFTDTDLKRLGKLSDGIGITKDDFLTNGHFAVHLSAIQGGSSKEFRTRVEAVSLSLNSVRDFSGAEFGKVVEGRKRADWVPVQRTEFSYNRSAADRKSAKFNPARMFLTEHGEPYYFDHAYTEFFNLEAGYVVNGLFAQFSDDGSDVPSLVVCGLRVKEDPFHALIGEREAMHLERIRTLETELEALRNGASEVRALPEPVAAYREARKVIGSPAAALLADTLAHYPETTPNELPPDPTRYVVVCKYDLESAARIVGVYDSYDEAKRVEDAHGFKPLAYYTETLALYA